MESLNPFCHKAFERPPGAVTPQDRSNASIDHRSPLKRGQASPQVFYKLAAPPFRRPILTHQPLVFILPDQFGQVRHQQDPLLRGEIAEEDRVRHRIAISVDALEHPAQPRLIPHVVRNQVPMAHRLPPSPSQELPICGDLPHRITAEPPGPHLQHPPVRDGVAEDRMGHQLVHLPVLGQQELAATIWRQRPGAAPAT